MPNEMDIANSVATNSLCETNLLGLAGDSRQRIFNSIYDRSLRNLASTSKHFNEMLKEDVENDKIIEINQNNFAAFIKYLDPERDDSAQAGNEAMAKSNQKQIVEQDDKFSKHKLLNLGRLTVDQIKDVIKYIKVKNENIGAERPFVVRKIVSLEIDGIAALDTDSEQEDGEDNIRQIKGEVFKDFVELLPSLPALDDLSFLKSQIIGDEGATALAEALAKNKTLTSLNLRENEIGDERAKALAAALRENKTLTSLDLTMNQIGAEVAKALAAALGENKTLTRLDLWNNQIGDEGAEALAEALASNNTLTSLDLMMNQIGDEGAQHLINSLKFNTSVVKFYYAINNINNLNDKKLNQFVTRNQEIAKFVQEAPNHYDKKALASIINFVVSIKEEACGSEIASKETLIKENLKNLISQKGGKDDIDTLFDKLPPNLGLGDALSSDKFQNILIESKQSLDMPNLKRKNLDAEDQERALKKAMISDKELDTSLSPLPCNDALNNSSIPSQTPPTSPRPSEASAVARETALQI